MEDFGFDHGGVEILKVRPENEQSQDAKKKIKTLFENKAEKELLFANHVIFATKVSRQTVASFTCQNTSNQKF